MIVCLFFSCRFVFAAVDATVRVSRVDASAATVRLLQGHTRAITAMRLSPANPLQ